MFTLSEAYEALNGHDEFVVKLYDGKISFDYIVIFPSSFSVTRDEIQDRAYFLWEKADRPNLDSEKFWFLAEQDIKRFADIRRNFRGVTFDESTGEMISLPLQKFFNVNQIPETQYNLIKHHNATIYEKMDGTMIHFFIHNGKLEAATCRSTHHPLAHEALFLAKKNNIDGYIIETINNGWTPVFEYVAPHNQIVVQYKEPRLVYLISRERSTGNYHYDDSFPDKARIFNFEFGQVFNNLNQTEFEGYVCHLPNMIVKTKTPWYMDRHRAVDALMLPAYKLYKIVFDGLMDDLIAVATDTYKPALRKIYEEAQHDLLNEKRQIELKFAEIEETFENSILLTAFEKDVNLASQDSHRRNRKLFVDLVRSTYPDDFNLMMSLYQGKDITDQIKVRLMEAYRFKYPQKLYAKIEGKE
jgi:T4 RnlA family RNA ligase